MTFITAPAIAARLGLSSRGALTRLKAAGIPPAASVTGLGRYKGGLLVYPADTLDRLKRAAAGNRKPSTASK